jgi:hypothetical protein
MYAGNIISIRLTAYACERHYFGNAGGMAA